MTQSIRPSFNVFADIDGTLLQNGYIYVGSPNKNPETDPVNLYWDSALTQPASQPLKTINGVIVRNGTPSNVYTPSDFSMTVKNKKLIIISSIASYASFGGITGYAAAGVNGDITQLTALTVPLSPAQGGSQAFYCGAAGGGGPNAIVATPITPATGFVLAAGVRAYVEITAPNTGITTLNVGSTITQAVKIAAAGGLVALQGGELQPNMIAIFEYTIEAVWQLINPVVGYVPVATVLEYYGTTAPGGYLFANAQAVSRATYAALFAAIGTTYGVGDGSTTFNVPDKRGTIAVGADNMGGAAAANKLQIQTNITTTSTSTSASVASTTGICAGMYIIAAGITAGTTIVSIAGTVVTLSAAATATGTVAGRFSMLTDAQALGASGGEVTHKITPFELAAHVHGFGSAVFGASSGGIGNVLQGPGTSINTASTGSDAPHNNMQPSIVCNFIIKT